MIKIWLILLPLMVGVSTLFSWLLLDVVEIAELLLGWGLAGGNTSAGVALSRQAIGRNRFSFYVWSIMGHSIKFLIMAGILVAIWWSPKVDFLSVVVSLAPCYFILLMGESVMVMRMVEKHTADSAHGGHP